MHNCQLLLNLFVCITVMRNGGLKLTCHDNNHNADMNGPSLQAHANYNFWWVSFDFWVSFPHTCMHTKHRLNPAPVLAPSPSTAPSPLPRHNPRTRWAWDSCRGGRYRRRSGGR